MKGKLGRKALVVGAVLVLSLVVVVSAMAAALWTPNNVVFTSCTPGFLVMVDGPLDLDKAYWFSVEVTNQTRGTSSGGWSGGPIGPVSGTLLVFDAVPNGTVDNDILALTWRWYDAPGGTQVAVSRLAWNCLTGEIWDPSAAGMWLADVCEPYDGFSADGWMTWDTDVPGAELYVGASQEGPWFKVEANGPPWVFNQATLEALADMVGVDSYLDMWFKSTETGKAVHVESALMDREAHMDALCGE